MHEKEKEKKEAIFKKCQLKKRERKNGFSGGGGWPLAYTSSSLHFRDEKRKGEEREGP